MANYFDQFDPPTPPSPPSPPAPATAPAQASNFFDQFDASPAPAPATLAAPTSAEPNVWLDAPLSFASGVPEGAVETVMLPVTAGRLSQSGGDWLFDQADNLVRAIFGQPQLTEADYAERARLREQTSHIDNALFGAQDAVRGAMDGVLYDPQTKAGEYANMIGQFVAPGGLPSKATRMAPTAGRMAGEYAADLTRNAVLPAVAAQAAGDLPGVDGTAAEPWAETIGAIMGGAGGAMLRASNSPEAVLRRAAPDLNDPAWARAQALQDNSLGVRLSGPESVAQATDGASTLPNLMRLVEGSVEGGAVTGPFFAQRPGQVQTAVTGVLDDIAPQSAQPSALGPRAAQAADQAIDAVRQDINASTRPLYQAAEPQLVPDADFANIAADPRFKAGLARLRGNAELSPEFAGMPDNSIGVIDAVVQDMFSRGEAMSNSANALYGPYLGGLTTGGATTARNVATNASSDYAQALAEQAARRQSELVPLESGPLGQVASANSTRAAGDALLPKTPLVGSENELADAVVRMIMQDAEAPGQLIRQNLADRLNSALTQTQQGVSDMAGANFVKDIAGNPQREANLYAVLDAVSPSASQQFPEMLDVLEATGRRRPQGSPTAVNQSMQAELGTASTAARGFDLLKSLGASWLTSAGDQTKRLALRNSMTTLANMFTDPQAVQLMQQAIARGPTVSLAEAFARAAAQTAPIMSEDR